MDSRRVIDLTELDLSELVRKIIREERSTPSEPDRWLTTKEAADYLGMPISTLHKLTAEKKIPFQQHTRNGRLYFWKAHLDEWRRGNA